MNTTTENNIEMLMIDGKPINIGVVMHRSTSVNGVPVFGQNTAYLEYMSRIGNVIMISPRDTHIHTELHAICLPGGADVEEMSNSSYMQGNTNPHSTYFFRHMWKYYKHLPTLGICMGMQAVLAYSSESVITPHVKLPVSHPRDKVIDSIMKYVKDDEGNYRLTTKGDRVIEVYKGVDDKPHKLNSIHHQAYYPENIDEELYEITGISREHGNVEIVKSLDGKHLLIQAHPEEMNCNTSLSSFVDIIRETYSIKVEITE